METSARIEFINTNLDLIFEYLEKELNNLTGMSLRLFNPVKNETMIYTFPKVSSRQDNHLVVYYLLHQEVGNQSRALNTTPWPGIVFAGSQIQNGSVVIEAVYDSALRKIFHLFWDDLLRKFHPVVEKLN